MCICATFFSVNSSTEKHRIWAAAANTAINVRVPVSLQHTDFISVGHIHTSTIVGSYVSSTVNILRNFQTISHYGCIKIYLHQQCSRVPFFPHHHWSSLSFVFLIIASLMGLKQYLSVSSSPEAIFGPLEPSSIYLLSYHLQFLLHGRFFSFDLCRIDSLLLFKS